MLATEFENAGKRIRTSASTKLVRLERTPFDRSGIPAYKYADSKFYKSNILNDYEDGHSNGETPVPFPNTEVKPITSFVLVSYKRRSRDAVFVYFLYSIFVIVKDIIN